MLQHFSEISLLHCNCFALSSFSFLFKILLVLFYLFVDNLKLRLEYLGKGKMPRRNPNLNTGLYGYLSGW